MLRTDLTIRANTVELAALVGAPVYRPLLSAEADGAAWRLLDLFSRDAAPFEVELAWSAGSGTGASAQLTVARASRIAVYARSLTVRAANLGAGVNRVGVTAADGFALSRNVFEVRAASDGIAPVPIPIPPFAEGVRVDLGDAALLAAARLQLFDGSGAQRADVPLDAQPAGGTPIGGAASCLVTTTGATTLRAVFTLSL